MGSVILSDVIYNYTPIEEYESGLTDLIPDVIPEQKKPLDEPYPENYEDDLDDYD